jgi:hypothetical protein
VEIASETETGKEQGLSNVKLAVLLRLQLLLLSPELVLAVLPKLEPSTFLHFSWRVIFLTTSDRILFWLSQ